MKYIIPVFASLAAALWQAPLQAQEAKVITRTGKPQTIQIKEESPRGILTFNKKDPLIPAENIVDVEYTLASSTTKVTKYRPAIVKEQEAEKAKPGKRIPLWTEAIQLYKDLGEALTASDGFAKRHTDFKIALLTARLALEDGTEKSRLAAITLLSDFRRRNAKSWQVVICLKTVAQLQLAMHLYNDAEETFQLLAALPVSDDLKQFARLQGIEVFVEAGRAARTAGKEGEARKYFTGASEQLKTFAEALPKNKQLQHQQAQLLLAEMLTELDKHNDAQTVVKQILKDTQDKQVKAAAYNALGYSYVRTKKWKEARWEFLWVDVVYNQNKDEHAKALYYLAEVWTTLGQGDRARECLDQLLTDRTFEGTTYQRRALQEETERNKKSM